MMHQESCQIFGISKDDPRIISQPCQEDDPSLISTHDPIYFELQITGNPVSTSDNPVIETVPVLNKRLLWEKANIDLYQETLESILQQNFEFWNTPECINTLAMLIPQAYIQAAEMSVPSKENKGMNFKTVKSEDWLKAESAAKKASKKFGIYGKTKR